MKVKKYWKVLIFSIIPICIFSQSKDAFWQKALDEYELQEKINIKKSFANFPEFRIKDLENLKKQIQSAIEKNANKTINSNGTIILAYGSHQLWASWTYVEFIFWLAEALELDPYKDLFCFFGDGDTPLPQYLTNQGASTKQNLINFISQHKTKNIIVFEIDHGGGYQKRIDKKYACTYVPARLGDDPILDHDTNEAELEFSIFIQKDGTVLALNQTNFFDPIIWVVDIPNHMWGIEIIKYVPSSFFTNNNGQCISQVLKETYYLSYADSNGVVATNNIIWTWDGVNLFPDTNYYYLAKTEIIDNLDLDLNGVRDVPLAFCTSNNDTLLGIDMNIGKNYSLQNFSITSNLDKDKDGFITGFDLNNDGLINPQTIVSFQEVVKMHGELMTDLERQEIFSASSADILISFLLHCHPSANNPVNNEIIFALAPEDMSVSSNPFVFEALLELIKSEAETDISFLDGFNYVQSWKNCSEYTQKVACNTRLNDDGNKIVSPGPWPHQGDGEYSEQIMLVQKSSSIIQEYNQPPISFHLHQNFPNPFNSSTLINYELGKNSQVNLSIYNSLGQKVDELINTPQSAGKYSILWSAENLPNGIYYSQLKIKNKNLTQKMLLLK